MLPINQESNLLKKKNHYCFLIYKLSSSFCFNKESLFDLMKQAKTSLNYWTVENIQIFDSMDFCGYA